MRLLVFAILLFPSPFFARTHRSPVARRHFQQTHPCPANGLRRGACPGYVVDHVIPLRCGGPDAPSNMQWQTVAEAKRKDVWERKCGLTKTGQ